MRTDPDERSNFWTLWFYLTTGPVVDTVTRDRFQAGWLFACCDLTFGSSILMAVGVAQFDVRVRREMVDPLMRF